MSVNLGPVIVTCQANRPGGGDTRPALMVLTFPFVQLRFSHSYSRSLYVQGAYIIDAFTYLPSQRPKLTPNLWPYTSKSPHGFTRIDMVDRVTTTRPVVSVDGTPLASQVLHFRDLSLDQPGIQSPPIQWPRFLEGIKLAASCTL